MLSMQYKAIEQYAMHHDVMESISEDESIFN